MPRSSFILALLTASLSHAEWKQQGEPAATFDAKGPAGFKIHGTAKNVKVKVDGSAITVSLTVQDVDTDNSLRNRHLQEDTEAARFPHISLTVPLSSLQFPAEGAKIAGKAKGTFTFHGQARELPFNYAVSCTAKDCTVDGDSEFNLGDHGVKVRSYLGVTVKPEVKVGAHFVLAR